MKFSRYVVGKNYNIAGKKSEKFDVVQPLLSFFDTIPTDNLKIYFILLFSFSKCPLLLIKVNFDWNFALNKYSLRAYLQSRLPRLIRVEASNTAGRVHQLQAFFLFLRGRHYTFVYLAA
jgi:hypothetical protein